MNEETQQIAPSPEYSQFLADVKNYGVRVEVQKTPGDKESDVWLIPKGCLEHQVTDENMITFRRLTRFERRSKFHKSKFTKR